ncbi:hypothetical protein C0992_005681 [Termitomyces sp. T32_za158]|nr:hypothetical protein C0992_005681 [Termitomyces sp. T32_za158]
MGRDPGLDVANLVFLVWAQEHHLLLDGLSMGMAFVAEELVGLMVPQELTYEIERLAHLMGAHRDPNIMQPGSWLEAFVDRLQVTPSHEKLLQMVRDTMEYKFGLGENQGVPQKEQEGKN